MMIYDEIFTQQIYIIPPGTFTAVQLHMAAIAPCAGKSLLDGVEERDRPMALRPGPRRNRNGRQETEENGPQNEENEIDKRSSMALPRLHFYGRSRFVQ